MPNKIQFSKNWNNKLNCNFFTTIRKPETFNYYSARVNELFQVLLNNTFFCSAYLKDANLVDLADVNPELHVLDTGSMDWKKIFENFGITKMCTLLLFERLS
jgi:hypothetical protein